MDAYGIDYKKSMKAFEDMTDTRVYNWEVGYERYDFSYEFKYKDPIYEHPTDYHRDIFPENLCGKLLFRYINNNIMPYIIKGKYFSTSGKYIDGKYKYRHKYSRVMFDYGDNCPLTGMCYDYYLLKPIIDYYNAWCTYPDDFSFEDLIGRCYDSFFKSWYEEYEYWADNEIWDDWLQLTQYFPNKDIEYYEAAYVRYNAYDSPTEVYSGFGETEVESRAMLLFDLLEKKILTPDGLNLKEVDRRKEYENEFE